MDTPTAALTLVVEKGPRKGETVDCKPGRRVRIGRVVKGNTLAIKDAGISQAHLSFEAAAGSDGGWEVTDLGSSNGTLLNGVRIEPSIPSRLRDGDIIKIGEETAILVRIAAVEAPVPQASAGLRRNPRRGCTAGTADAPRVEAHSGARVRGRPRGRNTAGRVLANPQVDGEHRDAGDADGGDDAAGKDAADLFVNESVKEPRKKAAARRGRGTEKKTSAALPRELDSVMEESEKERVEAEGRTASNITEEVDQEIPGSVQIYSVKGVSAGVRRGSSAARGATGAAVVSNVEQMWVDDERDAPLKEEREAEDISGANSDVGEHGVDMESMTLDEWFDRMEKYLPKVINEIAEEIILEIKAEAERFNEYLANSLNSEQGDLGDECIGLR